MEVFRTNDAHINRPLRFFLCWAEAYHIEVKIISVFPFVIKKLLPLILPHCDIPSLGRADDNQEQRSASNQYTSSNLFPSQMLTIEDATPKLYQELLHESRYLLA